MKHDPPSAPMVALAQRLTETATVRIWSEVRDQPGDRPQYELELSSTQKVRIDPDRLVELLERDPYSSRFVRLDGIFGNTDLGREIIEQTTAAVRDALADPKVQGVQQALRALEDPHTL